MNQVANVGLRLIVIGSLCLVAWLGEGSLFAAEPKKGGTLRFGVSRNPTSLNPVVRTQSIDESVRSLVYEAPLGHDRNLEPLPGLAQSWTVSTDGLIYVFHIRPGVKFHNGSPLSAMDLRWSIEYGLDPKNGATGRADLAVIERVETEEPDAIRIQLKSPYAPFLSAMSSIQVLPVFARDSIQAGELTPDAYPPGTGPFRFGSWRSGQELRLARFEGYWQKGLPYLDEIRFLVVPDEASRMNAVRAGDLDVVEEISREQIVRIRERKVPGIGLALAEAASFPRLGINHCRPPFNDRRVRQAFAFAVNKQDLLDAVFSGLGQVTNQRFLRGSRWFITDVPDRKQDPARAKSLLAEIGRASCRERV